MSDPAFKILTRDAKRQLRTIKMMPHVRLSERLAFICLGIGLGVMIAAWVL